MNITKIENFEQAFLLEADDLNSLNFLFDSLPGETLFVVETSDGFDREFDSINQVLNHENSPENSIQKIEIKKRSSDPYFNLEISFNKRSYRDITCLFITKEEQFIPTYTRIMECVNGTKPWYSKLSKADLVSFILIAFLVLIFILNAFVAFDLIKTSGEESNDQVKAFTYFSSIVIVGSVFGIAWIMNRLKNKIFPSGTFAIGHGKKRYKNLENVRWVVIIGGAISITVSLISSILL